MAPARAGRLPQPHHRLRLPVPPPPARVHGARELRHARAHRRPVARRGDGARAQSSSIASASAQRLTHRPGELSGGEQQRVALARALVMEPRVLLADEPTGNLDTHTGEEMHELFVELNRERGMTLVVVTHNPDFAARLPRRVRMVDGVISDETSAHCAAMRKLCARSPARSSSRSPPSSFAQEGGARSRARVEFEGRTIGTLKFKGNHKAEDDAIRVAIKSQPGEKLSVGAAARRHPRHLAAGLLRGRPGRGAGDRRQGRPHLRRPREAVIRKIYVSGAHEVGLDKINEVLDIKKDTIVDLAKVKRNVEKIKDLYVEKGFYLAEVDSEIQRKDETHVDVYFNVDEHAKVEIRQVTLPRQRAHHRRRAQVGDGHAGGRLAVVPHLVRHLPRGRVRSRSAAHHRVLLRPRLHQREARQAGDRALGRQGVPLHHDSRRGGRAVQDRQDRFQRRSAAAQRRILQAHDRAPGRDVQSLEARQGHPEPQRPLQGRRLRLRQHPAADGDRRRSSAPSTSSSRCRRAARSTSGASTSAATPRRATRSSAARCGSTRASSTTRRASIARSAGAGARLLREGRALDQASESDPDRSTSTSRSPSAPPARSRSAPASRRWRTSSARRRSRRTTCSAAARRLQLQAQISSLRQLFRCASRSVLPRHALDVRVLPLQLAALLSRRSTAPRAAAI